MEFANLGDHCSVQLCKQKDFLPFTCDACKKVYCLEHRSYVMHECPNAAHRDHRAIVCPICSQTIQFTGNADENVYAVFDEHQRNSCHPAAAKKTVERCSAPNCKEKLLLSNRTTCPKCRQDVCLRHRHEDDHACPRVPPGRGNFLSSFGQALGLVAAPAPAPAPVRSRHGPPGAKKPAPVKPQDILRETAYRRQQQRGGGASEVITLNGAGGSSGSGSAAGAGGSSRSAASGGPERCPHCSAGFADPVALVNHVESVHAAAGGGAAGRGQASHNAAGPGSDPDGPSSCPQCGAAFPSIPSLIAHVERDHPDRGGAGAVAMPSAGEGCRVQ